MKNKVEKTNSVMNSQETIERDFLMPEFRLSDIQESIARQQILANKLKKFPNQLTPLLQKFKKIKEKKEKQNRLKIKIPEIEREYKRIEKELAEYLIDTTDGNSSIEVRINEKDTSLFEVVEKEGEGVWIGVDLAGFV